MRAADRHVCVCAFLIPVVISSLLLRTVRVVYAVQTINLVSGRRLGGLGCTFVPNAASVSLCLSRGRAAQCLPPQLMGSRAQLLRWRGRNCFSESGFSFARREALAASRSYREKSVRSFAPSSCCTHIADVAMRRSFHPPLPPPFSPLFPSLWPLFSSLPLLWSSTSPFPSSIMFSLAKSQLSEPGDGRAGALGGEGGPECEPRNIP